MDGFADAGIDCGGGSAASPRTTLNGPRARSLANKADDPSMLPSSIAMISNGRPSR